MKTHKSSYSFAKALLRILCISQLIILSIQAQAKTNPAIDTHVTEEATQPDLQKIVNEAFASLEETDIPKQTSLQQTAASAIFKAIDNSHLVKGTIDDVTPEKVFERYIKSLDPNKFYFLQSDIDHFRRSQNQFLTDIESGDLKHQFDIFNVFRERVENQIRFAIKRLHQPFDFELDEQYETNREDSTWAKTEQELQKTWRKRIKNDILIEQINDEELTYTKVLENLQRRYLTVARTTRQLNDYDVFQFIINAYTHSVEPHTTYLTPRASENFDISMRLSLQGIGAVLQQDNEYTVVRRIITGGPADKDGRLQADERIIGVGQTEDDIIDVIGWRLDDVVEQIRGEKGTEVYLRVLPDEKKPAGKPRTIKITRDNINLEERRAQSTIKSVETENGEKQFAIINIDSFYIDFAAYGQGDPNYRSTTRDVKEIINNLDQDMIDGIIIDLRNNGGGGLPEAISLAGLFIEEGPIVQIESFFGQVNVERDPDPSIVYGGPLAVLTNQYSASASEIFAGAIKDYNRGYLIGEPTFGKGTVQNVQKVSDLSNLGPLSSLFGRQNKKTDIGQLNITIAQFYRVNGSSTQYKGVKPHIQWSTSILDEETGERAYDNAIPWRQIKASEYEVFTSAPTASAIEKLTEKHIERTKANVDFIYFSQMNKLRVSRKDKTKVSLNRETRFMENQKIESQLFDIENKKRLGKGEQPYASIAEFEEAREAELKQRRTDESPEFDDPYLSEAALILNDFITHQ